MKRKPIPQFELPGTEQAFNLAGETLKQPEPVKQPIRDADTLDMFGQHEPIPLEVCGIKPNGFMPGCVLAKGHAGEHQDGFGGHYGRADNMTLEQVPGYKEMRHVPKITT